MVDQKLYELAQDAQPKIIAAYEAEVERREQDERNRQTLQTLGNALQQASAQIQQSEAEHEQRMAAMNATIPTARGSTAAQAGAKAQYKVIPRREVQRSPGARSLPRGLRRRGHLRDRPLGERDTTAGASAPPQLKIKGKNPSGSLVYALDDPGYRSCVDQCVGSIRQCRNHCPHCAGDRLVTP